MSTQHEENSQRRHDRVTVPLYVTIHDQDYLVVDWSLGGFRVADYPGDEQAGAELNGTLVLPYPDFKVKIPIRFRIVHRDDAGLGCAFIEQNEVQRKALRHLLESGVEGRQS